MSWCSIIFFIYHGLMKIELYLFINMDKETIYGSCDDSHVVMSEKVQSLAGSIYQEFEKMITKYDEDVVKDLMPLVVNVLECLDLSYTENQEHEVELELLREDNEQLVTQYEREKQLRKSTEQKLLEIEDASEDERNELFEKIESLESIVRMLELKAKNSSDHVYRLEEREQEMKKEYTKLHERYTELFKTHMDCMERTKILMGSSDRVDLPTRNRMLQPVSMSHVSSRCSGPVSFSFSSLEGANNFKSLNSPAECPTIPASPPDSTQSNTSLKNELNAQENKTSEKADDDPSSVKEISEKGWSETLGSVISKDDSSPEQDLSEDMPLCNITGTAAGKSHTKREQRSGNTLYQELSFQDAEALGEIDDGADITGSWVHPGDYASSGMGKEVENLIMENNELLATKNALNVVKDDLIVKVDELTSEQEIMRSEIKSLQAVRLNLKQCIEDLEGEVKQLKDENEKLSKTNKSDDEEDVPMAQRKRFTRVEMARVLMERNQYKERYMELQEAVRWSEMIRASKHDTSLDKKNKQSVWKFFSSLFSVSGDSRSSSAHMTMKKDGPLGYVHYNVPTHHISPALETMRKRNLSEQRRGLDYIDPHDMSNEKSAARRALEKKEQFRQVRAHVCKDDGRLRAYGWSVPSKAALAAANRPSYNGSHVPVPVPIYCRPLMESKAGMKLWCATGVNLSGGMTRDGGMIVGASVFYQNTEENEQTEVKEQSSYNGVHSLEVEKLNEELKEGEQIIQENEEPHLQNLSSLVWICVSTKSLNTVSTVSIVDANNPADVLESFTVCQSHVLCIASVPGAKENDYVASEQEEESINDEVKTISLINGDDNESADENLNEENSKDGQVGKVVFVSCAAGSEQPFPSSTPVDDDRMVNNDNDESAESLKLPDIGSVEAEDILQFEPPVVEKIDPPRRLIKEIKEGLLKDGLTNLATDNDVANEEIKKVSSILPTIWLGSQNGYVFVHSAVSQWCKCLHSVRLKEPVLGIVHVNRKVICALADGTIAVFNRAQDGQWDLSKYYSRRLGPSQYSVRCLAAVHSKVWCGYKNTIHVFNPTTLTVQAVIEAHPRKESQVRQLAWLGDGVWVSIRLDSTLRLYHAHTHQHLQDVDVEPYVSKMLGTGKLGFSFVRITALLISSHRLWIGTGNGVIISVPLSESAGSNASNITGRVPGGVVRIFSDPSTSQVTPGSFIPYCSMSQAQLSFHGHRDAVKFFVAVPGNGNISATTIAHREQSAISENTQEHEAAVLPSMLIMSGGEGYIDFRAGDVDEEYNGNEDADNSTNIKKPDPPYLIVWQGELKRSDWYG